MGLCYSFLFSQVWHIARHSVNVSCVHERGSFTGTGWFILAVVRISKLHHRGDLQVMFVTEVKKITHNRTVSFCSPSSFLQATYGKGQVFFWYVAGNIDFNSVISFLWLSYHDVGRASGSNYETVYYSIKSSPKVLLCIRMHAYIDLAFLPFKKRFKHKLFSRTLKLLFKQY